MPEERNLLEEHAIKYEGLYLHDPTFADWLRPSLQIDNNSYASCEWCGSIFSAELSAIKLHAESKIHEENVRCMHYKFSDIYSEDGESLEVRELDLESVRPSKNNKKLKYAQKYKHEWKNDPAFNNWLEHSCKGPYFAYCTVCKKNLSVAFGGKTDLEKHAMREKHLKNCSTCCSVEHLDIKLTAKTKNLNGTVRNMHYKSSENDLADSDSEGELGSERPSKTNKKSKYDQKYRHEWKNDPVFQNWLHHSSKGQFFAYCTKCKTHLSVASGGKFDLIKHAVRVKHLKNC